MKKAKRFLTLLLCIFAMGALFAPVYASATADCTLSADNLKAGDTFTATVSIKEVTASSLGVSIECDDTLEIIDGKWLKSGLIASFDPVKNKGAYTAGGAAPVSGDIFEITFLAKTPSVNRQSIFVTVVAKNSTTTLFSETVEKTVNISCKEHDFGNYDKTDINHSRQCKLCKYTEEQKHVWNKGSVTLQPTCEKNGEKLFTCMVCSYGKVEKIDKLSHTPTIKDAKKATCIEEGYTGDKVCSECDTLIEKGSSIAKTSHTPTIKDAKKATCIEEGYTGDKVCSECDTLIEKGSSIAKTSHTPTIKDAKKATCIEEGYTGDKVCSACDTLIEKGSSIAKTSHTPTIKDAKKATCIEEGYTGDKVCSVCDALIENGSAIVKTSHTTTVEGTKKATCNKEGYTGDKVCSECDTLIEKGTNVVKTSHNYTDGFCVNCNAKDPDEPSVPENTKPTTTSKPDTTTKPTASDKKDSFMTPTNLIVAGIVTLVLVTALAFVFIRKRK